ncbi:hypothetical protein ACN47E_003852 [Coniothyrium glycines]
MASADVIFKHKPLDKSLQEIRLVSVDPTSLSSIKCVLKRVNLGAATTPDYRALSYVWGPPKPSRRITVNNRTYKVRLNLFKFLEAFRSRLCKFASSNGSYDDEVQWLWIDQICIDQTVNEERNHQVAMMSTIYSRATYVYLWLGPSDDTLEEAMRILKSMQRQFYEDRISRTSKSTRTSDRTSKNHCVEGQSDISFHEKRDTLSKFFQNSYWRRLWIVQEVMLARYIRIMCGETVLSWDELHRFCLLNGSQSSKSSYCNIPPQLQWLAERARSGQTYNFLDLLHTFSSNECHDPRDKVFGLQGLLAPEERVVIDYSKDTYVVFGNVAGLFHRNMLRCCEESKLDPASLDYSQPAQSIYTNAVRFLSEEARNTMSWPSLRALVVLEGRMGLSSLSVEDWEPKSPHLLGDVASFASHFVDNFAERVLRTRVFFENTQSKPFENSQYWELWAFVNELQEQFGMHAALVERSISAHCFTPVPVWNAPISRRGSLVSASEMYLFGRKGAEYYNARTIKSISLRDSDPGEDFAQYHRPEYFTGFYHENDLHGRGIFDSIYAKHVLTKFEEIARRIAARDRADTQAYFRGLK